MEKEHLRYDPITKNVIGCDSRGIEGKSYPVSIENDRNGGVRISYGDETEFVSHDRISESAERLVRNGLGNSV
jgi:hypothetical protein